VDSGFSEIHWAKSFDNGLKLRVLCTEIRALELPFFTLKAHPEMMR
jgi:hypothetical protein